MTLDEITKEAFDLFHAWKDRKFKLHFEFSFEPDSDRTFQAVVEVFDIRDDHASITLDWRRRVVDPADKFLFIEGQGYFGVMLKDATFDVSQAPVPTLTISHGPFRCTLRQLNHA